MSLVQPQKQTWNANKNSNMRGQLRATKNIKTCKKIAVLKNKHEDLTNKSGDARVKAI